MVINYLRGWEFCITKYIHHSGWVGEFVSNAGGLHPYWEPSSILRETDRQAGRQAGRQMDRKTERYRETERECKWIFDLMNCLQ